MINVFVILFPIGIGMVEGVPASRLKATWNRKYKLMSESIKDPRKPGLFCYLHLKLMQTGNYHYRNLSEEPKQ